MIKMKNTLSILHKRLIKSRKTVAVAESCTGGLISELLTHSSGSSLYFLLGIVAYSNAIKEKILDIPDRVIKKNGAVSRNVAIALAKNVRGMARSSFGIGITGIAGPTGGNTQKPKGTVFICISTPRKTVCSKFKFRGNRVKVRKSAALKSLQMLLKFL